jgi:hypothetical protein
LIINISLTTYIHIYITHIRSFICTTVADNTALFVHKPLPLCTSRIQISLDKNTLSPLGLNTVYPLSFSHYIPVYISPSHSCTAYSLSYSLALGPKISPDKAQTHAAGRLQFSHTRLAELPRSQTSHLLAPVLPVRLFRVATEDG